MYAYMIRLLREERAASAVEYALIVSLIALAIIAAVTVLGTTLAGVFTTIVNA
ncbi:hypothetical protein LCGC14_2742710, partial [marine sediment metagenome]